MKLHPSIFRAYDIRGIYPKEFDAEGAARIAAAFVAHLEQQKVARPKVVLARDARLSSDPIAQAVRTALVDSGAHIFDIGLATTPLFYFAIQKLQGDGGLMVTASHNPPPANGLKLCRAEAVAIGSGSGLETIRDLALSGESFAHGTGDVEETDVQEAYFALLHSQTVLSRPLRVVIDPGNGMAGLVLEKLLPMIPELSVERLHFDVDCTFPNHEANPLKEETLEDMKTVVRSRDFDIGIAFDGDADRVGFVAPDGRVVSAHYILALLAQDALRSMSKGTSVVHTVNVSRIVPETVRENGGEPIAARIGHAFASRAMREKDAVVGGEVSGHYYFRELKGRDDGIFAALRMLSILSRASSLESLLAPLRKYVQSDEINFEVSDKEATLKRVEGDFADAKITRIDGLTVEYDNWWFNLRPSNTEDLLRLNMEARTQKLLDEKLSALRILIGS